MIFQFFQYLSYLDNEGDLWLRGNTGAKNVTAGEGGDKKEEREEKREARKQARILNIEFGNLIFSVVDFFELLILNFESLILFFFVILTFVF